MSFTSIFSFTVLSYVGVDEARAVLSTVSLEWQKQVVSWFLRLREEARLWTTMPQYGLGHRLGTLLRRIKRAIDPASDPDTGWSRRGDAARSCAAFENLQANLEQTQSCAPFRVFEADSISPAAFRAWFEAAQEPALVNGLAAQWPAASKWLPSVVVGGADDTGAPGYGACAFSVGESAQDGSEVQLPLRDYLRYCLAQQDDTPLYIFDRDFAERCPAMIRDFDPLYDYLAGDLFALLGGSGPHGNRPPHRWLLVGARGSGSDVHVDPPGTCAWNAVVSGMKYWALIDPRLGAEQVESGSTADDVPPLAWFCQSLPRVSARHPGAVRVVTQGPGSVMFIPRGWWHAVWNIKDTIGVTVNRVSWRAFCDAWQCARRDVGTDADAMTLARQVEHRFGLATLGDAVQWLLRLRAHAAENDWLIPDGLCGCVSALETMISAGVGFSAGSDTNVFDP